MTLSAIIIARDEEKEIAECIKNVFFADEVIVVDNCSQDQTARLARELGAKVYKVKGVDFSHLRNYGRRCAKGKWLLYIDADERVSDGLAGEIIKKVSSEKKHSAFFIKRKNYYFGKPWPQSEEIIRLIRKDYLALWKGKVHETAYVKGSTGKLDFPLYHYTHKDLGRMVEKTNDWSRIEAKLMYNAGHPKVTWWRLARIMATTFWRYYFAQKGYKLGIWGFIESIYQSFSSFITYAKLWEIQVKHLTDNIQQMTNNNSANDS